MSKPPLFYFTPGRVAGALLSLALAVGVVLSTRGQSVLHLYVRSPISEDYQVTADSGAGFEGGTEATDLLFPAPVDAPQAARMNFPVPRSPHHLRIGLGQSAGSVTIERACLETHLLSRRCVGGAALLPAVEASHQVRLAAAGSALRIDRQAPGASFTIGSAVLAGMAAPPLVLAVSETCLTVATALFFFPFVTVLVEGAWAGWNAAAGLVLAVALGLRAVFAAVYATGTVSDSDLFFRYLGTHLFHLPGIRGLVYPGFLAILGNTPALAGAAQSVLGGCGALLVFLLLGSFRKNSGWDVVWALAATSIPTLLAMERLILSESLALFLLLAALLILRRLQLAPESRLAAAALGSGAALLYHTKPQFGFAIGILACVLLALPGRRVPRLASFVLPVLAFWLFAVALTNSAGNFAGVSSSLGYSLFNHGQQNLHCPEERAEPLVEFYCRAERSLGAHGSPLSYTAWVMYPAIHELHQPFPEITARYARLSARLIERDPAHYLRDVWLSFALYWTGDISMVQGLYAGQGSPALRSAAGLVLRAERWVRDGIVALFCLALLTALLRRKYIGLNLMLFCGTTVALVIGSAVLQALVEFGPENARLAIPTEPLLLLTTVLLAGHGDLDFLFLKHSTT